jgi:hypothetical protein
MLVYYLYKIPAAAFSLQLNKLELKVSALSRPQIRQA